MNRRWRGWALIGGEWVFAENINEKTFIYLALVVHIEGGEGRGAGSRRGACMRINCL